MCTHGATNLGKLNDYTPQENLIIWSSNLDRRDGAKIHIINL